MIWPFTVTAENCQHQQFPEILGTNFQVTATIPEKDWGNVRQSVLLPKIIIVYTQLYIDYLKDKDPSSVKFFDESGFQLPDAGHRNFGFSLVGEDCVEARRYLSTANLTELSGWVRWSKTWKHHKRSVELCTVFTIL